MNEIKHHTQAGLVSWQCIAKRLCLGALFWFAPIAGAQTWTDISANVPGTITSGNMGVMATDGTRLYVLGQTGVFVSENGGATFSAVNSVSGASYNLGAYGLRFVAVANGLVWVGADPGSASLNDGLATLHRLTPGQTTWAKSDTGFPYLTLGNQADDIAYDSTTGTYYVAAALGGAFVSTDGQNWVQRNNGNGGIGMPATVEAFNGLAFIVRPLGGVNRTVDQGVTWTATGGIPGPGSGTLLRLGNRILIATTGYTTLQDGLYYSDDLGVTWTFTQALPRQVDLSTDGTLGLAAWNDFFSGAQLAYSATGGTTWDSISATGIVGSPNRLVKVGANLFVHTAGKLFRAPASSFNFTPATKIVKQPVSSPTLLDGGSYTFSVVAGGQNVTYQWKKGMDDVPGANGPTLTISPLVVSDTGSYTVVVTGDNGVVTSSAAALTVVTAEQGKVDPTFPQPTNRRPGSTLAVLKNYDVIELSGNFIQRFRGTAMAASRNLPTGNFFKLLVDSRGRLVLGNVAFSGNTVFRIDPNTLQDDPTFTPFTLSSSVTDMVELPGRGYLVSFTSNPTLNGTLGPPILLLNYDGNIDWSFNTQGAIYQFSQVDQLIVTPNGEIYARGTFNYWWDGTQNNSQYVGFVRLLANGTLDATYQPAFRPSSQPVFALRDGRLLMLNGTRPEIYNRNGVKDSSFNSGNLTFSHTPTGIAEQFDGKIIFSGTFTSYGGVAVDNYVRLNTDGTRDTSFYDAVGLASTATIPSVAYDPQGFVYVTPSTDSTSATWQTSGRRGLSRFFTTPAAFGIWQQPVSGNVDQSGAVSLSVTALGSGLTYQWFKNGQAISGATGATLNISAFDASKDGSYTVQVSNGSLTETSQAAVLKSVGAPVIFRQPASANLITNTSLALSVGVHASSDTTFQWFKNGQAISGATGKNYSVSSVALTHAGRYSVAMNNQFGSVTSDVAVITVNEITGSLVTAFTPPTINGNVYAIQVLADKSVLIGGDFTTVNSVTHSYYAKLTSTGGAAGGGWTANPPGGATGIRVFDFEVLPDGKVMMGGDFTGVQGSTYDKLARLNTDGTVDTGYTSTAFGGYVRSISRLPDGKLLVGGTFTTPKQYLARMNENGTLDSAFTLDANNWVFKILALPDGKVYVAGNFTALGGQTANRIVRLNSDLTRDGSFNAPVFDGQIQDLDVDGEGRVVVVGSFTQVDGQSRIYIARLNANGSLDTSFNAGSQLNSGADAVDVQFNGAIVVGGSFTGRFKRLLPSGAADPYFTVASVPNGQVLDLETTADGLLYVSGFFTTPRQRVAVYTTSKSDPAVTSPPQSLAVNLGASTTLTVGAYASSAVSYQWFKNGLPLAGQTASTLALNNVTKADAGAYSVDVTSAQGTVSSPSAIVTVLAEPILTGHPQTQSTPVGGSVTFSINATGKTPLAYQWRRNGVNIPGANSASLTLNNVQNGNAGNYDVVVSNDAGSFTSFPAGLGVYALLGAVDSTFTPGTFDNSVHSVAQLPNGNIAVGGDFGSVGGTLRTRFAMLDSAGGLVSLASNPTSSQQVVGIAPQPDGKFIVGSYLSPHGVRRYNSDGTLNATISTDQTHVFHVSGTTLYVGGYFGGSAKSIRKYSLVDGSEDTAFNGNATATTGWLVYAIFQQSDGKVLVGNHFGNMVRLNADGTTDTSFTAPTLQYSGGGSVKYIYAIAQTADGKIWIGGQFDGVGASLNRRFLARLNSDGSLDEGVPDLVLNNSVKAIIPQGNDVLVAGLFNKTVNTVSYGSLLRVSGATGAIDTNFGPSGISSINGATLQADGKLLVVGSFSTPRSRVARIISQYTGGEAIAAHPASVSVLSGQPFTLAVGWYGGSAATYQWYKNNSPINGATGQSYVVNAASPADAGSYYVTVTTTGGTMTSSAGTVTVNNPPVSFIDWKSSIGFIPGVFDAPGQDPDGDGIPNIAEYVFGSHPLQGGSVEKPKGKKANDGGTDYPAVEFIRNASANGATVIITAATDVGMVNVLPTTTLPPVSLGNGLEKIVVRIHTPLSSTATVFFHVKVAQP